MYSDHHFLIGRSHSICQDYAASLPEFAALADGCSCVIGQDGKTIEAHTDIGARLLVRAAFHHRFEIESNMRYRLSVNTADGYRRQLDLGVETISATLITLRDEGKIIRATICGDGLIAGRHYDGKWECWCYQFDGHPYYPRYCLLGTPPTHRLHVSSPFSDCIAYPEEVIQQLVFNKDDFDLVVAASDGVFSFTKSYATVQFDASLAARLLDFRRLKGLFVHRHLSGVLKELAEDGIVNQDDISMIAISL